MRNAKISPLVVGGKQKNTMKLTFKYKEHSATSFTTDTGSAGGTWTTVSNLTNSSANLGASFSVLKSYDIIGTIEDSLTSYEFLAPTVGTDSFPLALKVDRMGLGKLPEQAGIVDSAWQYYYDNKPIQHQKLTNNDGTAILLTEGTDLDSVTKCGFYNGNNLLHAPTGSGANGWQYIRVSQHTNSANYILQEAIDFNGAVSAYRVKNGGTWKPWQYYAVQNTVANFTAVNQTKFYMKKIDMPYSAKATVTRIGNQVQLTWDRLIINLNTECEYTSMTETIPSGYRPTCEAHMTLNGNVSNSVNSWAVLHLAPDGTIRLTNAFRGNHVWTGTITYLTTDPFPAE